MGPVGSDRQARSYFNAAGLKVCTLTCPMSQCTYISPVLVCGDCNRVFSVKR